MPDMGADIGVAVGHRGAGRANCDRVEPNSARERPHLYANRGVSVYRLGRSRERSRCYMGAFAGWNTPELSASSSARITCTTALINARWVNACGKLPRCRPVRGSISSA